MKKFSFFFQKSIYSIAILPFAIMLIMGISSDPMSLETTHEETDESALMMCPCPNNTQTLIISNGYLCCDSDDGNQVTAIGNCSPDQMDDWTWQWIPKANCTITQDGSNTATIHPISCEGDTEVIFAVKAIGNPASCSTPRKGKVFRLPVLSGLDCFQ